MTNKEKALLKHIMKHEPKTSNTDAADECGCTVATARRHRRWFAPSADAPKPGSNPTTEGEG